MRRRYRTLKPLAVCLVRTLPTPICSLRRGTLKGPDVSSTTSIVYQKLTPVMPPKDVGTPRGRRPMHLITFGGPYLRMK